MTQLHPEVHVTDQDGVRWIELQRPQSKNALTVEVNQAMIAAIEGAAAARVIVLGGAGGAFSSGLDLKDAMKRGPRPPADMERDLRAYFHGLILAVRRAPQPTIAAVDGPAAGFGCDLALACDVRLLSDRARFGEIFVRRGLMPDGGATWTLQRLVGTGRALELLYTGDTVEAERAMQFGLGNQLWPTAEFHGNAWAFARRLAAGPPRVLRLIKRAVHDSAEGPIEAALDREAKGQLECLGSKDFLEGVAAFLGKRDPKFTGE
jgi:2-(1,2-epoxy-1,2-dihydrophenyl)acetyl-CoA isomerase